MTQRKVREKGVRRPAKEYEIGFGATIGTRIKRGISSVSVTQKSPFLTRSQFLADNIEVEVIQALALVG